MIILLNMILAEYESSSYKPLHPSHQRFSDRKYKYAWFTRDISNDEENVQQNYQMDFKDIFNRK
jgi:hypothetical protein